MISQGLLFYALFVFQNGCTCVCNNGAGLFWWCTGFMLLGLYFRSACTSILQTANITELWNKEKKKRKQRWFSSSQILFLYKPGAFHSRLIFIGLNYHLNVKSVLCCSLFMKVYWCKQQPWKCSANVRNLSVLYFAAALKCVTCIKRNDQKISACCNHLGETLIALVMQKHLEPTNAQAKLLPLLVQLYSSIICWLSYCFFLEWVALDNSVSPSPLPLLLLCHFLLLQTIHWQMFCTTGHLVNVKHI